MLMATLLDRLAVYHLGEQLGEQLVTLATLGIGELLPHGGVGAGWLARGGVERSRPGVHHCLLSVVMHQE